jgi:quinol monooxygenase YgiN
MIRTILHLRTTAQGAQRVMQLYRDEAILRTSLNNTHALESEISQSLQDPGTLVVTALWPDEAAYQEWLDHPRRADSTPRLAVLLDDAEVGSAVIYRVIERVNRSDH